MKSSSLVFLTFFSTFFFSLSVFASGLSETEITALLEGDLKKANNAIDRAINEDPSNAQLHKIAGDVFAVRAQGASVFSAPGLAKKTLKSYKKAVELEPNNTRFRMSLMQFYLFAPSIVGGSKKRAAEQAIKIKKLDAVSGVVADSFLLLKEKDHEGLDALFTQLPSHLLSNPRIKMAQANYMGSLEAFDEAAILLTELVNLTAESLTEEQALLPYQAMLQMGFLAMDSEAHQQAGLENFKRYLESAPDTYKLTSKKWVRLFLGKLYATAGKSEMAKATLMAAKETASDKSLLNEIEDAISELN